MNHLFCLKFLPESDDKQDQETGCEESDVNSGGRSGGQQQIQAQVLVVLGSIIVCHNGL